MVDLSLVPLDELLVEAEKRCVSFNVAYKVVDPQEKEMFLFRYGKGQWCDAVFLSDLLHNDCRNNWNGELRTLQRINDLEEDGA